LVLAVLWDLSAPIQNFHLLHLMVVDLVLQVHCLLPMVVMVDQAAHQQTAVQAAHQHRVKVMQAQHQARLLDHPAVVVVQALLGQT
jgi:competence protein ComGC